MSQRKVKIIHIEDEPEAQRLLKGIIRKYIPEAEYSACASNLEEGLVLIRNSDFDLLFLDLQLSDGDGMSLIRKHTELASKTILCTADDSKGIEAVKNGIFYYILKPINIHEVIDVIKRYHAKLSTEENDTAEVNLLENKLIIPDINGLEIIPIHSIIRMEAEQNYTHVYLNTGEKIFASKTLGFFEDILQKFSFVRIHRSHLINVDCIKRINKNDGGSVELTTGEVFKVSGSGRNALREKLNL
ncbi:response regulator transcription factor [Crocinitomicaceae bacterium CZZ-1]|uniref:Response regulator transcription factor n=1 Tax=Taishania pollutisoli TaxID=2766479 RepID=A0A8J6U1P6_9FLAO|nr:LytTR family DNA-binding domain-containing protein [Taishania pollutisoli]MBC9811395.1 response regulator transcription factor [Taishania pollutisoli]MBX2947690.1 response regulator transcription factor [Crocinitomicaceae bacterium]NGF75175.1 response regulator transcription factor [Fluviicola sp. SGL-29]